MLAKNEIEVECEVATLHVSPHRRVDRHVIGGIFVWNVIKKSLNLQARMFEHAVYALLYIPLNTIPVVFLFLEGRTWVF